MREFTRRVALSLPLAGTLLAKTAGHAAAQAADTEWRNYGGDLASTRYVPLDQINADNFSKMELAWRFTPDMLGAPGICL
jgi:quinoprotein glucose dehydrogenase